MKNLGYYNGEIGLIEEMKVPMLDRGMYFGDGVYEATFTLNYKIFALDEHLDRLYRSAKMVGIQIPYSKDEIKGILNNLVKKVDTEDQFLYWQITRGTAPRKHDYSKDLSGNLYITLTPFNGIENLDKRIKLITVEDTRFLHCNIKTLNLLPNVIASQKATEAGCQEAVFHRGNIVTEAAHSNVHIIKNGVFRTHPTNNLILAGISRKHVLDICKKNNMNIEEVPFSLKEMMEADEILVTSSSKLIVAADEINGIHVGGGAPAVVKFIQDEYTKKVKNETA